MRATLILVVALVAAANQAASYLDQPETFEGLLNSPLRPSQPGHHPIGEPKRGTWDEPLWPVGPVARLRTRAC